MIDPALEDHIRIDTRLAGQVQRYHTWKTINKQTISEHCWQILRIYFSVVEKPDIQMVTYIIYHDIGEHYTGDVPYPVKARNPALKEQMDVLEHRSLATQLGHWGVCARAFDLTSDDLQFFKTLELIEMAEFGLDEVCLGNSYGHMIADRCLKAVFNQIERPPSQRERKVVYYMVKRIDLFLLQCVNPPARHEPWWFSGSWEELISERRESNS